MTTTAVGAALDRDRFRDPDGRYRSVPFLSWNDDLDDDELRRQIGELHRAGQGGFFIHARIGLRTPYLSEAWFHSVRTCLDEARRLGMAAWLYDEDRWPSGFAGGLVPALGEAYRSHALIGLVSVLPIAVKEALVRVTGRLDGGKLVDVQPWSPDDGYPSEGRVLVQCYPWTAPMGQGWFGGTTFLNTLNPEAVAAFLRVTYDRYAAEVGEAFGGVVPGMFTDEPSFWYRGSLPAVHGVGQPPAVPWDAELPEVFRQRHGYDFRPHLHALFFDVADGSAVRHDYWETVTARFSEAWSEQLYGWCERHGIGLTGHHMAEDDLLSQMRWTGGVMPHYRHYQVPGIDKLGRSTRQVVTVKQLDSVVEQAGKGRALCEAFGCSGQDFAIEGRWWVTNWLAVLGINLLNPHLVLYSMRGERKRDYPPNLSYQQPWWPYQRPYEDAAGRLCYALSQGRRQVDVLVLHPMTSAWVTYAPTGHHRVSALDRMLVRLTDGLLAMHRDFHFGDETVLADLGAVEGETLRVGEQTYRAVVVPPMPNLRRSTAVLLERFAAAGGRIIGLGQGPASLDGRPADGPVLPATTTVAADEVSDGRVAVSGSPDDDPAAPIPDLPALRAALHAALSPRVAIDGVATDRVWYQARRLPDGRELLFLANTREREDATCAVRWQGDGAVERWDLVSGATTPQPTEAADGTTRFSIALPRMAGALFVRDPRGTPAVPTPARGEERTLPLGDTWQLEELTPNALVLDRCQLRLGEAAWGPPIHVLRAAEALEAAGYGTPFAMRFAFTAEQAPDPGCALVVEEPRALTVAVNGARLDRPDGWWVDQTFHRYPVGSLLRAGENEVEIAGTYAAGVEPEALYLTGPFAVPATRTAQPVERTGQQFAGWRVEARITPRPARRTYRSGDDLVADGFPHLAGELRLEQELALDGPSPGARVTVAFDRIHAAAAVVEVNGQVAGQTLWPPYAVEITDLVRSGSNTVAVRLVTSLRNLLGPLHVVGGDGEFVSPQTFRDMRQWTDDCWLVPLGLAGAKITVAP